MQFLETPGRHSANAFLRVLHQLAQRFRKLRSSDFVHGQTTPARVLRASAAAAWPSNSRICLRSIPEGLIGQPLAFDIPKAE
jgi:hypothetical protein